MFVFDKSVLDKAKLGEYRTLHKSDLIMVPAYAGVYIVETFMVNKGILAKCITSGVCPRSVHTFNEKCYIVLGNRYDDDFEHLDSLMKMQHFSEIKFSMNREDVERVYKSLESDCSVLDDDLYINKILDVELRANRNVLDTKDNIVRCGDEAPMIRLNYRDGERQLCKYTDSLIGGCLADFGDTACETGMVEGLSFRYEAREKGVRTAPSFFDVPTKFSTDNLQWGRICDIPECSLFVLEDGGTLGFLWEHSYGVSWIAPAEKLMALQFVYEDTRVALVATARYTSMNELREFCRKYTEHEITSTESTKSPLISPDTMLQWLTETFSAIPGYDFKAAACTSSVLGTPDDILKGAVIRALHEKIMKILSDKSYQSNEEDAALLRCLLGEKQYSMVTQDGEWGIRVGKDKKGNPLFIAKKG